MKATSAGDGQKTLMREGMLGPGLLLFSFATIVGVASALGNSSAGGGTWLILVAATRAIWTPNLVSLVYRRRWSRFLLWPFSVVEESECIRVLTALSWAYLVIGVFLLVVAFL